MYIFVFCKCAYTEEKMCIYGRELSYMVFDKHCNGVPVAWVISSCNTTYDIHKWFSSLFSMGVKECPDWCVRAFIIDDAAAEIQTLRFHIFCFQNKYEKLMLHSNNLLSPNVSPFQEFNQFPHPATCMAYPSSMGKTCWKQSQSQRK